MERLMTQVEVLSLSAPERRRRRMVVMMGVLGVFALVAFFIIPKQHDKATFGFVMDKEWVAIHEWAIDSRHGSLGFAILAILAAILAYFQFRARKTIRLASAIFGVSFLMSFLCWAASGKFIPLTGLLQGGLLLAVPLIYGAMAGVLCERSGVINIAIEGQLLAGAFASGVLASLTQKTWVGLLIAPFAGALIAYLLAVFAIKFAIDQVILGFVLNVLVIGLTDFLYKRLLIPYQATWNSGPILSPIKIPVLWKIPILGP